LLPASIGDWNADRAALAEVIRPRSQEAPIWEACRLRRIDPVKRRSLKALGRAVGIWLFEEIKRHAAETRTRRRARKPLEKEQAAARRTDLPCVTYW
jgi:hypothetical protein